MGETQMLSLEDAEALAAAAKNLARARKEYERIRERANRDGISDKARAKAETDLTYAAMHIDRMARAAHARAVDAGVADLREAEAYGDVRYHLSAFHETRETPARPRAFAAV